MQRSMRLICAGLLGLALAGCAPIIRNHGYVPPDDRLAEIEVGRDTRETVAETVGRPTAEGVLDDSGWFYVQSRFRQRGWRAAEEVNREVVAISFGPSGTVSNVERFGLEQGRVVPLSRRVTEANVRGTTFLRQLFGGIGNFNPVDFLDDG